MKDQLLKSLEELNRVTGLCMSLSDVPEEAREETTEKLLQLTRAWKSVYDQEAFWRRLLSGSTEAGEVYAEAARFGIREGHKRTLFVVSAADGIGEEAARVLKHLFVTGSGDVFVRMDDRTAALLRNERPRGEEASVTAHTIADMLSTEILLYAKVSYIGGIEGLLALPAAYTEALTALKIAGIFYSNEQVCSYTRLGVGKLIYDLPKESCRKFLYETLGQTEPYLFDDETVTLINAFFANNLSIAEAARQLYLHRNTMSYRLDKLRSQTGLDLRVFDDALTLKLVMMISNRLRQE